MRIGFAVVDITPELGIYLTGYGRPERLAEGVHSPLNASIMVVGDGKTSAAVVGLDWCFVDRPLTQAIRREIGRQSGIPEENILLCCSHTHSAPHTACMRTLGRSAVDPENRGVDYALKSAPVIAAGVREAGANLRECTAGFAQTKTLACVSRRGMDENGKVRGFIQDPDQICDNNMVVVRFLDAEDGRDLGILVHTGGHNTAMGGNTLISSDWCGVMKERIRNRYRVPVVFVNGALGDVGPRSNRFVSASWCGKGYSAGGGDGVKAVEEVGLRAAGDLEGAGGHPGVPARSSPDRARVGTAAAAGSFHG
ncbi:MAG: neutral/alkaline non-lysosomal ceramidase N-terminal domain-containing protein [Lentisphaeria bacterium]|nr:neutral/alkaline non-lysosomal ceramidase N-terminal domain-containing protein [Lentisphaeria bacterium]